MPRPTVSTKKTPGQLLDEALGEAAVRAGEVRDTANDVGTFLETLGQKARAWGRAALIIAVIALVWLCLTGVISFLADLKILFGSSS